MIWSRKKKIIITLSVIVGVSVIGGVVAGVVGGTPSNKASTLAYTNPTYAKQIISNSQVSFFNPLTYQEYEDLRDSIDNKLNSSINQQKRKTSRLVVTDSNEDFALSSEWKIETDFPKYFGVRIMFKDDSTHDLIINTSRDRFAEFLMFSVANIRLSRYVTITGQTGKVLLSLTGFGLFNPSTNSYNLRIISYLDKDYEITSVKPHMVTELDGTPKLIDEGSEGYASRPIS